MTQFVKIFALYIICCFFSGCEFALKKEITANHFLIINDTEEDSSLCFQEFSDDNYGTLINAQVFSIGNNEKYIIAKQHPRTFPNKPNKSITNYFILPIERTPNWKTRNGLIGPLNLIQFEQMRKKLNIPKSLNFTFEI